MEVHISFRILSMLSKIVRPHRILELGTFTGYSALCLSEGLREGGKITTIDRDRKSTKLAAEYFERAGVSNKVPSNQFYFIIFNL